MFLQGLLSSDEAKVLSVHVLGSLLIMRLGNVDSTALLFQTPAPNRATCITQAIEDP